MPDSSNVTVATKAWAKFASLANTHPAVGLLARSSHFKPLQRSETLVEESDDDTEIYLVGSGRLRSVRVLKDGQEVWLADAGPGELIGELSALTGQKRSSTVIASTAVQVFAIDRKTFLSIAEQHGRIALALATLLAARLVQTSGHVADLFGRSVVYRVHRELVRLGTPSAVAGELVRLSSPPTITALKQLVHAGREATSRAMTELEERGVVIRKRGEWIVKSLPET